jgi:choline dehydrogenase
VLQYLLARKGLMATGSHDVVAFVRTRPELTRPDAELVMAPFSLQPGRLSMAFEKEHGIQVFGYQLRPESRGTITLRSPDPFAPPVIDPNYLAAEEDRRAMRESVKICREIVAQTPFDAFRGEEVVPGAACRSDAEIDTYIRETGETIYHPVGTVAMGANDSAPLDGELRLRGIEGLRVVDASVMPTLIGGNTNAPTIMIAEKAADMVLGKPAMAPAELELSA